MISQRDFVQNFPKSLAKSRANARTKEWVSFSSHLAGADYRSTSETGKVNERLPGALLETISKQIYRWDRFGCIES